MTLKPLFFLQQARHQASWILFAITVANAELVIRPRLGRLIRIRALHRRHRALHRLLPQARDLHNVSVVTLTSWLQPYGAILWNLRNRPWHFRTPRPWTGISTSKYRRRTPANSLRSNGVCSNLSRRWRRT